MKSFFAASLAGAAGLSLLLASGTCLAQARPRVAMTSAKPKPAEPPPEPPVQQAQPTPEPPPAPAQTLPPAPPPAGTIPVAVSSNYAYTRVETKSPTGLWVTVCVAPCTAQLLPGEVYRVDAPGMTRTEFVAERDARSLTVSGGSRTGRTWGIVMDIVGGAATGAIAPIGEMTRKATTEDGFRAGASGIIALAAIGLACTVTGLVMYWTNDTSVTQSKTASKAASTAPVQALRLVTSGTLSF